ncbi:MAG TPA: GNAT family protein [Urbifossiella sp.]|nr:GNAT family protein [Urbifossiella sp.]
MLNETNSLGQRVGVAIADWVRPPVPTRDAMERRFCNLEPLNPEVHGQSLFDCNQLDTAGRNWTYLPYGPFAAFEDYGKWLREYTQKDDPLFFAIVAKGSGRAVGVASYLRIDPGHGSIEVGGLNFSPLLQNTPAATEAMYLMMERAFRLGYRRYEWKCNALNAESRRAAQRFGFSFEGVFRQAAVYKGRNRDTAWYSVINREWPALHEAFLTWLDPSNFDATGRQLIALSSLTQPLVHQHG